MRADRRSLADDDGGAGVETAFAVTALLLVLFFVVGGMRVVGSNGDVSSAARSGARAAATARTQGDADSGALDVVSAALSGRGVACEGGPGVSVSPLESESRVVSVTVTCVVSLDDVVLAGFPGSRTVTVTAVEYVDQIRSDG